MVGVILAADTIQVAVDTIQWQSLQCIQAMTATAIRKRKMNKTLHGGLHSDEEEAAGEVNAAEELVAVAGTNQACFLKKIQSLVPKTTGNTRKLAT